MPHRNRVLRAGCSAALLSILIFGIGGCGGSSAPGNLVPVSGKVICDGQPLTRGSVSFRADNAGGNTSTAEPYGTIEADGTYTLYTEKHKGAPPGKYIVLVEASEEPPADIKDTVTPKAIVNPKYSDLEKPLLKVEVVENPKSGQYDLTVSK